MRAATASSLAVSARPSRSAATIVALAGSPTSAAISAMIGPVIISAIYHGPRRDSPRQTASVTRVRQFPDRPDLDDSDARRGEPRSYGTGLVHVLGIDEEESPQLLLRLGERAIGGGDLSGTDSDGA